MEGKRSYDLSEENLLSKAIMEQITMEQIYMGIDVAKDSFVVAIRLPGKVTTSLHQNNKKGIAGFLKNLPDNTWCIMEAESQMHGLRSAGSECIACNWRLPYMKKELRYRWLILCR